MRANKSCVHFYYGNGKGKTTAAVGLMVRAVGQGMKVLFLQYFKKRMTGELIALQYLPGITCYQFGTGHFILEGKPSEEDYKEFSIGWEMAKKALFSSEYDLIVMDEFVYAFSFHLLAWDDFLSVMNARCEKTEVVLTGRKAIPQLIEYADLVTNMSLVKHPYQQGIPARKGIEY